MNNDQQPMPEPMATNPTSTPAMKKPMSKGTKIGILVVVILIVLAGIAYSARGFFIAATVNGSPISRFAVIKELEKESGAKVLDALITRKLINDEAAKNKIVVTDDEVNAEIKKIEGQIVAQGSTLAAALSAQGMTDQDLKDQVSFQIKVEKLLGDKVAVTDEEVTTFIKDNKVTLPKGQEAAVKAQIKDQIVQQKITQQAEQWVISLKSQSNIKHYVNY